jgi:transposase-like protein
VFIPPRCPALSCIAHSDPQTTSGHFYVPHGSYHPKCRAQSVPRFKCRLCGKTFSRQTFRMDYCDNKPSHNATVFKLLASGLGLRQCGRIVGLSRRCTELKARKISRHLGRINRNLTGQFGEGSRFMLDEMETFEGERAVLPVTVPVLIETNSMFVIATDVATIKPSGRMSDDRREAIQRAEERHGPREDRSANALARTFRRLRWFCKNVKTVEFSSDKKHMYSRLLRKFFGSEAIHLQTSSKRKRDQTNPLRHINLTNAMARDLNGRLRRESWLVSKKRRYLRLQLHVFAAYRNFIRRRVNRETPTPAQLLGFVKRPVTFDEMLSWRQDWQGCSIHPFGSWTQSIEEVRGQAAAA